MCGWENLIYQLFLCQFNHLDSFESDTDVQVVHIYFLNGILIVVYKLKCDM